MKRLALGFIAAVTVILLAVSGAGAAVVPERAPARLAFGDWRHIDTGGYHSCGVRDNGTLWCWGYNRYGQLGDGTSRNRRTATRVGTWHNWKSVTVGDGHTCAIRATGTLWCWGENLDGELGDGTFRDRDEPVRIGHSSDWLTVDIGRWQTCGLREPGTAWCWGPRSGRGGTRNVPTRLGTASTWTALGTSGSRICGLRGSGALWCGTSSPSLARFGKRSWRWTSLSVNDQSCAIRRDRSLWCWGDNHYRGIGKRTEEQVRVPTLIGRRAMNWRSASGGGTGGCAVRANGSNWCWGYNDEGRVGDGTSGSNKPVAARTVGPTNWVSTSAGPFTTCGVRADGSGWCWGSNHFYQVGDGTDLTRVTPVRVRNG